MTADLQPSVTTWHLRFERCINNIKLWLMALKSLASPQGWWMERPNGEGVAREHHTDPQRTILRRPISKSCLLVQHLSLRRRHRFNKWGWYQGFISPVKDHLNVRVAPTQAPFLSPFVWCFEGLVVFLFFVFLHSSWWVQCCLNKNYSPWIIREFCLFEHQKLVLYSLKKTTPKKITVSLILSRAIAPFLHSSLVCTGFSCVFF